MRAISMGSLVRDMHEDKDSMDIPMDSQDNHKDSQVNLHLDIIKALLTKELEL